MTNLSTRCRSGGWLLAFGLGLFALTPGNASADATLQVSSSTSGTTQEPVQIGSSGSVIISQASNGQDTTLDSWTLILAIPNVTAQIGSAGPAIITEINSATLGTPLTSTLAAKMTSSDVYTVLNLSGPNSVSFVNMAGADKTIDSITATDFGLYEYTINQTLAKNSPVTLQIASLPGGSYVAPWGENSKASYSTKFTLVGLTGPNATPPPPTPPPAPTPEPSTMVLALLGGAGLLGYRMRRSFRE